MTTSKCLIHFYVLFILYAHPKSSTKLINYLHPNLKIEHIQCSIFRLKPTFPKYCPKILKE